MTTPYPVDIHTDSGLRRIRLEGRIDGLSAGMVQDALMALVDDGERRLLVDLSEVVYLSSAGIRVLLIVQKLLRGSNGELVLVGASELVQNVFEVAGLTGLFTLIPDITQVPRIDSETDPSIGVALSHEAIALRTLKHDAPPGQLRAIGDHRPLDSAGYQQQDVCAESLLAGSYACGLAAAGDRFEDYSQLFGEAVVIDGNFFVLPGVRNPRVDYVLREWSGDTGTLRFLHGFSFSGEFRHSVQFEDREHPIDLERLRRALFAVSDADLLGVVMVAESRGHWGMSLRRSPMAGSLPAGTDSIFAAEQFADWINFPLEPSDNGALLAVTGLMARDPTRLSPQVAALFPADGTLHLHALVMQKGHLSRRVVDFQRELQRVLANQLPEQVCHLLPETALRAGLVGIVELEA